MSASETAVFVLPVEILPVKVLLLLKLPIKSPFRMLYYSRV